MMPFPAGAATVTQEAEIPWSEATTVSPPPVAKPSAEQVVPPGDIGTGLTHHNVIFSPLKRLRRNVDTPKQLPGEDGMALVSCHRARDAPPKPQPWQ